MTRRPTGSTRPDTLFPDTTPFRSTVRAVLKDARISEQAGLLQGEVGRLLDDVRRLDDRVGRLQGHFRQADEDMRQIRISTEKIDKRAERIREVEVEARSEEHTSELQSLMRNSYAVFCLKKKK